MSFQKTTALVVQGDDATDEFYPSTKFDLQLLQENSQVSQEASTDYTVDELQAVNTALCFLCSVNADSTEVERFLKYHPESLLLEGVCLLPEDSANFILTQHMRRCKCNGLCSINRQRVRQVLELGFEYFQSHRLTRTATEAILWNTYFSRLVEIEHQVRLLRREELTMRNTLLETSLEVKSYEDQLQSVYQTQNGTRRNKLQMILCSVPHKSFSGELSGNRQTVLEYQVGVASVNLKSVQREHASLLSRIREGRRAQFGLLKKAFGKLERHDICSIGYVRDSVASASSTVPSITHTSASGRSRCSTSSS